ncbi:hypothetical protein SGLAM104S_06970 [Streptomyces glaucescens]
MPICPLEPAQIANAGHALEGGVVRGAVQVAVLQQSGHRVALAAGHMGLPERGVRFQPHLFAALDDLDASAALAAGLDRPDAVAVPVQGEVHRGRLGHGALGLGDPVGHGQADRLGVEEVVLRLFGEFRGGAAVGVARGGRGGGGRAVRRVRTAGPRSPARGQSLPDHGVTSAAMASPGGAHHLSAYVSPPHVRSVSDAAHFRPWIAHASKGARAGAPVLNGGRTGTEGSTRHGGQYGTPGSEEHPRGGRMAARRLRGHARDPRPRGRRTVRPGHPGRREGHGPRRRGRPRRLRRRCRRLAAHPRRRARRPAAPCRGPPRPQDREDTGVAWRAATRARP